MRRAEIKSAIKMKNYKKNSLDNSHTSSSLRWIKTIISHNDKIIAENSPHKFHERKEATAEGKVMKET